MQKIADRYKRSMVDFVFDGSVLCQQGVNAGMSQQDESGDDGQDRCKGQEVGRGQMKIGR